MIRISKFRRAAMLTLTGALALSAVACHQSAAIGAAPNQSQPAQQKQYKLHGKVIAIDAKTQSLIVSHGAIPGFMDAMTMAYRVKDPAVLPEVHAGDTIFATLVVPDHGEAYLADVVITAQARPDTKPAAAYHVPTPGDAVPDFTLINQSGKSVRIAQYRGKVLLVTFIYTRCPLGDYCVRMSRNFAQINKALSADPAESKATHLLSISFDPRYDTPAVLKSYGEAYTGRYGKEDFAHWTFAAATPEDLDAIEHWFGVGVTPGENNTLNHSLSTCVIDRNGKVTAWYPSNDWTVAQVMSDVRKAAGQA